MTDIQSTEGVSLQELIRSSAIPREKKDDKEFVKDPAKDVLRAKTLDELVEERRIKQAQGDDRAESFEDSVRESVEEDEVTKLVQGLTQLDIEPPPPSPEALRTPDLEAGAATFNPGLSLTDTANANASKRREILSGTSAGQRTARQNVNERISDRTDQRLLGDRIERREAVQGSESLRSVSVVDSRESVDSSSRSRGELFDLAAREQGDPQNRLVNLQQSIGNLVSGSDDVDRFVSERSQSGERVNQEDALFGAQQIEEAISSNQASNALRLLDEQQALAVLNKGEVNAVVVGSEIVEGVDDDGRVTQTRLEQDGALRTPGSELFFNNEADRDLGNILNGVS